MIKPYDHQQKIWDDDPLWCLIAHGTGGAKTRTALGLAKGKTLVICPKQQVLDRTWEENAARFNITLDLTVMSKETFRRDWDKLISYDTIIVDECHTMLGVTPDTRMRKGQQIPKTSQMFEALYDYVNKVHPDRFYLLSATPASKPMHVWAIGILLGKQWSFFGFRDKYYIQRRMGYRSIWLPSNSQPLKLRLAELIKSFGYTGKLSDWFDVPEQTHKTVHVELTGEQKKFLHALNATEADPMAKRAKQRTIENGCLYDLKLVETNRGADKMVKETQYIDSHKIHYILERAEEFPKLLIFANYLAQIEAIAIALRDEGYTVYTLTGSTKDRASVVRNAEEDEKCIVIAQCGISSGYELKSINCVIFASKSFRYVDYEQALGRVLRADALKKNLYIHLVLKGGTDEECHKAILSGMDFQEKIMS